MPTLPGTAGRPGPRHKRRRRVGAYLRSLTVGGFRGIGPPATLEAALTDAPTAAELAGWIGDVGRLIAHVAVGPPTS